jgi:hypothetical protein
VDNNQGGHHLLDLQTGCTIKRHTITTIPITENFIDLVHSMAENDNMNTGLKKETRSGTILYDSAWIAGVDYDLTTENKETHKENHENNDQDEGGPENTNVDVMIPDELAEIMQDKTSQALVEFNDNNANAKETEENDDNNVEIDLQNDEDEARNGENEENEQNEEENDDEDANPIGVNDDNNENDDDEGRMKNCLTMK